VWKVGRWDRDEGSRGEDVSDAMEGGREKSEGIQRTKNSERGGVKRLKEGKEAREGNPTGGNWERRKDNNIYKGIARFFLIACNR
jgi:hypothetical protein